MTEPCPFCQLVKDGLPPHAIYQDADVFVMLDRTSLGFGHSMVIPKRHEPWIYRLGDGEYTSLLLVAKRLANILQQSLQPKAVAYVVHGAGLPHVHLHLVPLSDKDEINDPQRYFRHLTDAQLQEEANRLRELLPADLEERLKSDS